MAGLHCPGLFTVIQIKVHIFMVGGGADGQKGKKKILLSSTVFIFLWPELQLIYTYDLGWHGGERLLEHI